MVCPLYIRQVLIAGCMLFATTAANANDAVQLPGEISGARKTIETVTVTGTLEADGNTIVVLEYPADVIRIRSVKGGEGFAFRCPSALIESDTLVTPTTGRLTIDCWDVQPVVDQALFVLEVEFLAGPGTEGSLKVIRLDRRGSTVIDAAMSEATVTAQGSAARQDLVEGITGNYPNPFSQSTDFVFRLTEPGQVHLSVLTVDGRLVIDLKTFTANAGENVYHFAPNVWDVYSGPYIFSVETETFTYLHQFMVLK